MTSDHPDAVTPQARGGFRDRSTAAQSPPDRAAASHLLPRTTQRDTSESILKVRVARCALRPNSVSRTTQRDTSESILKVRVARCALRPNSVSRTTQRDTSESILKVRVARCALRPNSVSRTTQRDTSESILKVRVARCALRPNSVSRAQRNAARTERRRLWSGLLRPAPVRSPRADRASLRSPPTPAPCHR
jgi:autonomous glycyl radical cofactor GrcA